MISKTPLIALIGLPNAGKSTLLNKLTGTKKAITAREAHTTRDLNYADTEWENMYLRFVDTGGMVPDPEDKLQKEIQIRSGMAIAQADLLVWVLDRKQDPETISDVILRKIWKTGKPFLVCVNKVDNPNSDRSVADYARLGGKSFVNVSSFNGYGINTLLDEIVRVAGEMGFEKSIISMPQLPIKERKKRKTTKEVNIDDEGGYYITRENSESGPGLFQAVEVPTQPDIIIKNVIYDLFDVLILNKDGELALNDAVLESIEVFRDQGKNIFYASNVNSETKAKLTELEWLDIFDGGLASCDFGLGKPEEGFFVELMNRFDLVPEESVFIDNDETNVQSAINLGMWGISYSIDENDLLVDVDLIESGQTERVYQLPKLLLLGRPNVGKSTLFNTLFGSEVQIVTDIPGTTLSVNDMVINHNGSSYIILDTAGIRKSGQRTTGVETFATFRTVQAAHEADVILFMVDGSTPMTHQDQVVAGIVKEAKKGVVVIANKADLTDQDSRKRFMRDFMFKFAFLKVARFVWFSASRAFDLQTGNHPTYEGEQQQGKAFGHDIVDVERLWKEIDEALQQRKTEIDKAEVRKLFNYIIKRKPPQKLRNKKRAILYDLVYSKSSPPTFELLIKDKHTLHWSYLRFLENIIRRQFRFDATGVTVKLKEVDRKKIVG